MTSFFGSWEFWNVPNIWDKHVGGKPCPNQNIPLESFQIVNVESEFAFSTWNWKMELWPKEGLGIKLVVWFPTIKIQKNRGQMTFGGSLQHWIEEIWFKVTIF